jgi:predicted nucleic acid-binding protein
MTVAADASVVVKLYFAEEYSAQARALFGDAEQGNETTIAPHLLAAEFVNIVRRKMRREGVPLARASAVIDEFLTLPIEFHAEPDIYREAILLTERYSLSGFDAQYVALAQLAGCDLWAADERMRGAIRGRLPFVKWIGDYPLGGPNGGTC